MYSGFAKRFFASVSSFRCTDLKWLRSYLFHCLKFPSLNDRRDCDGINELCCKHYNNHSMMKPGRKGKQVMDFRPGDKVCCSRNAYVIDYTDRDSTDISQHRASGSKGKAKEFPEIRLCNGEIFFIKEVRLFMCCFAFLYCYFCLECIIIDDSTQTKPTFVTSINQLWVGGKTPGNFMFSCWQALFF